MATFSGLLTFYGSLKASFSCHFLWKSTLVFLLANKNTFSLYWMKGIVGLGQHFIYTSLMRSCVTAICVIVT